MPSQYPEREFDHRDPSTWSMHDRWVLGPLRTGLARPLDLRLVQHCSEETKSASTADLMSFKEEISTLARRIFFGWRLLNGILSCHETLLAKRWSEKMEGERRQLLMELWPDIPSHHRPDLQVFQKGEAEPSLQAQMWPFINLEDLGDHQILPLLIRSRGRNLPPVFAYGDLESCRLGMVLDGPLSRLIRIQPLMGNSTMLMQGATSEHTYGTLTFCKDVPLGQMWSAPVAGWIVMKVQDRLLDFLLHCCRYLLVDQLIVSPLKDFNPSKPDPGDISIASAQGDSEYRTIIAVNTEAAYRVPTVPDFAFILSLVRSKKMQAEDTIFALREDPHLFANRIQDELDHSTQLVWGVRAYSNPDTRELSQTLEQHRLVIRMTETLFMMLQSWGVIELSLQRVVALQAREVADRMPMSQELAESLHQCWYTLERLKEYVRDKLQSILTCCPALRNDWELVMSPDDPGFYTVCRKLDAPRDQLSAVLEGVVDKRLNFYVGTHKWIDEAERLFQKDETQRARISPYVLEWIAELGVVAEAQRQLQLFRMEEWADDGIMHPVVRTRLYDESMTPLQLLKQGLHGLRLWESADRKAGEWDYPYDKPPSKAVVHQLQVAEIHLASLWYTIDTRILERTKKRWFDLFDIEMRQPYRTSSYREPVLKQTKNAKIRNSLAPPRSLALLRKQQAELVKQTAQQTGGAIATAVTADHDCKGKSKVVLLEESALSTVVWNTIADDEKFDKKAASLIKRKEKTSHTDEVSKISPASASHTA